MKNLLIKHQGKIYSVIFTLLVIWTVSSMFNLSINGPENFDKIWLSSILWILTVVLTSILSLLYIFIQVIIMLWKCKF